MNGHLETCASRVTIMSACQDIALTKPVTITQCLKPADFGWTSRLVSILAIALRNADKTAPKSSR
jgi:hypothetical protein